MSFSFGGKQRWEYHIGAVSSKTPNIYVCDSVGEQRKFTTLPTEDDDDFIITSMAVNDEDAVFVLIRREPIGGSYKYTLYRFDPNDDIAREIPLNFLSGEMLPQLAVAYPENFVISTTRRIYACSDDNPDGNVVLTCDFDILHVCISDTNQIILSSASPSRCSAAKVHIYTMEGKQVIEPFTILKQHSILSLAFNFTTKEILVRTYFRDDKPYLLIYSMSGENQTIMDTTSNVPYSRIISHPKGPVVLLGENNVLRLQ